MAEYLFRRLYELGIRSVHGLPGDYNLVALDYIPGAKLKWVGSVNELNAGKKHFEARPVSHMHPTKHLQQPTLPTVMPASKASLPSSPPLVLASSPP